MAYADQDNIAKGYGDASTRYSDAWTSENGEIAHAILEKELVRRMLGDCTGYKVLDIAGGSGNHARQAVELGASKVDVVDISEGFMAVGKQIEAAAGRSSIDWHLANAYSPLAEQVKDLPAGGYDIVMANWAFDHCSTLTELEALWKNIATYLKHGGRFVSIRVANPKAKSADDPRYGVRYHHHQPIEGGVSYKFTMLTKPPFTIDASSMETSYNGSTEYPEKAGITGIETVRFQDLDGYKADPSFWSLLIEDPYWVGFTGKKQA